MPAQPRSNLSSVFLVQVLTAPLARYSPIWSCATLNVLVCFSQQSHNHFTTFSTNITITFPQFLQTFHCGPQDVYMKRGWRAGRDWQPGLSPTFGFFRQATPSLSPSLSPKQTTGNLLYSNATLDGCRTLSYSREQANPKLRRCDEHICTLTGENDYYRTNRGEHRDACRI